MSWGTAATCSSGAPERLSPRRTAMALAEIPCGFSTAKWKSSVPSGRGSPQTKASDSQAGTRHSSGKGRCAIRGGTSLKCSAMSISNWMRSVRSGMESRMSSVLDSFSGISGMRTSSGSALDGNPDEVPPLGPAPIIVADLLVAQQVGQDEPGVAAALTDAAIDDHVVLPLQPGLRFVDGAQLLGGLEGAVLGVDGPRPGDVRRARDVAAAQGSLVRVVRHVEPLARVLGGAPHVDELTLGLDVPQHFVAKRPDALVVPLGRPE